MSVILFRTLNHYTFNINYENDKFCNFDFSQWPKDLFDFDLFTGDKEGGKLLTLYKGKTANDDMYSLPDCPNHCLPGKKLN